MSNIGISIIIPMLNIADYIENVLSILADETKNLNVEFITVDMGSTDKTMFAALDAIHRLGLNGRVIQCGKGQVGTALNFGLFKAEGEYVSFIFPRNFYRGFLESFYLNAKSKNVDFIFGSNEKIFKNESLLINELSNQNLIKCLVYNSVKIDAASTLISKNFLDKNKIFFNESCKIGYTEEFVLRIIYADAKFLRSDTVPTKEQLFESKNEAQSQIGTSCFDRIDALLRFVDDLYQNQNLKNIFLGEKIPQTIFYCADILLSEGYSINSIKNALKLRGYDRYLSTNNFTSKKTSRKIFIWKYAPKLYKIG